MLIGVENDPASWEAAGEGGLGCLFFFFFLKMWVGFATRGGPQAQRGLCDWLYEMYATI